MGLSLRLKASWMSSADRMALGSTLSDAEASALRVAA